MKPFKRLLKKLGYIPTKECKKMVRKALALNPKTDNLDPWVDKIINEMCENR